MAAATAALIDPFAADQHKRFAAAPSEEAGDEDVYPLLFSHVHHPTMSSPSENGSDLLIVDTLEEFELNRKSLP